MFSQFDSEYCCISQIELSGSTRRLLLGFVVQCYFLVVRNWLQFQAYCEIQGTAACKPILLPGLWRTCLCVTYLFFPHKLSMTRFDSFSKGRLFQLNAQWYLTVICSISIVYVMLNVYFSYVCFYLFIYLLNIFTFFLCVL